MNQKVSRFQQSLDDKYALDKTRAFISGVEALVRLPILQHQRDQDRGLNTAGFISGYRGSPLGGVDKALWHADPFLKQHNIHFTPGINEDMAASAVWGSQQVNLFEGAQYDGVFGMWYGKGPGVDRSMDVIKHANAFGTSRFGGVLAIAGDDHACKSSTLPHQSEHMFIGASIPVLNPCDVQEVLDLGIFGWELSRYCGCWVALKAITDNMDSAISADIDPKRVSIITPSDFELPEDGVHARLADNPLAQERRLNKYKIYAAREFARVNGLNKIILDSVKPRLGIITTGKAYLDVMQALEDLGIDEDKASAIGLRIYKVGMSWPLEPVQTHDFAKGLEEIIVVEEKRSIIEDQLTGQLYNWPVDERPRVVGEFDEVGRDLLPNLSELTPALVAEALASRIRRFYRCDSIDSRLAFLKAKQASLSQRRSDWVRMPHYCSGCPHNRSTRLPDGSRAMAGIGCHYMAQWMAPERSAETFSQMGGEGVSWVGQAPFTDTQHVFQNLGDGTYFHSGLLAIRQSIAAGHAITYKILYNDAVAMTGGQGVDGTLDVEQMVAQLLAEGVKRVAVLSEFPDKHRNLMSRKGVTVDEREQLLTIENELRELPGTTALIFEQVCAAEKRRRRKRGQLPIPDRRVVINDAVCEGCGDCGKQSNCLSIVPKQTALGVKREINQHSCNMDYSCVQGLCPSFVSVVGGKLRRPQPFGIELDFSEIPEPQLPSIDQAWNIVAAGVGGTGVVTVTTLVAMAAHLEGKGTATLNQTGLAQKFGAVISHVRVARSQEAIRSVRIPAGDADLLLGCDLVVSTSDDALAKTDRKRSRAIINHHPTVTSSFIGDPETELPVDELCSLINSEVGSERSEYLDALKLSEALLGESIYSNVLLLGVAYQRGLVPVSAEALERAIQLNEVAVDKNLEAFRWGRAYAWDATHILQQLPGHDRKLHREQESIDDLVEDRYQRLIAYQNRSYADHYRHQIDRVRSADISPGAALTRTVAETLYRLMAIKDEYEVARLLSSVEFRESLSEQFEGDFKLQFHLAAPLFASVNSYTGRPNKTSYPGWCLPLFSVLGKFKFLRGSKLDPFSYSHERFEERELLTDYQGMLNVWLNQLNEKNIDKVTELFGLAKQVKGFGLVKQQAIESYREKKQLLIAQLEGRHIPVVQVCDPKREAA